MKKLFGLVLLIAVTAVAFAAGTSSSTKIIAIVGEQVAVTGDLPESTVIDTASDNADLGSVTIKANTNGTWQITVHSVNGGYMLGQTQNMQYPYTVALINDANAQVLLQGSLASDLVATLTGAGTYAFRLKAFYQPAASIVPALAADTYLDTVIITVSML